MPNPKRHEPKQEPAKKLRRSRSNTVPPDPAEQNRERVRRHREKKRDEGRTGVELWIKNEWRDAIIENGQSLQEAADEAFGLLMAKRARRVR